MDLADLLTASEPKGASREADRRRAARWRPAVHCHGVLTGDGEALDVVVEDVSAQGARLALRTFAGVSPRQGARVEMRLAYGPREHRRRARVAWVEAAVEGTVLLGVEFERAVDGEDVTPLVLDARAVKLDPTWALRVPPAFAYRRRVLPLCEIDGHVHVACADPRDVGSLRTLERLLERPLVAQQADLASLDEILRRVYRDARATEAQSDPVSLCADVLHAGWLRRASDVHVDPDPQGVRIRLRVDGVLEDHRRLRLEQHAELISRIKVLAGLDIAERRAPQDGSFTHEIGEGERIEVRVATLPTKHGERATLRLLGVQMGALTLENLGLGQRHLERMLATLDRPHGLILATGPTGCGKTTTLYAALRRIIARRPVNAIAVQDPIEYDLAGVAQVEVDAGHKLGFGSALRSILRHDPDVILVGEVRDHETADIAIKAALTGHLVLATLHANSAASAVTRLVDMGVDRYLVAATLRVVLAQRLVRRLCPYCRQPATLSAERAAALRANSLSGGTVFAPVGCVFCAGRGHAGRLGIFELLELDEDQARAIVAGADEVTLTRMAAESGWRPLAADAFDKLTAGETSWAEVAAHVCA